MSQTNVPYIFQSVTTKIDNKETNIDMQFVMYGTNKAVNMKSGAYLFLPDGPAKVMDGITWWKWGDWPLGQKGFQVKPGSCIIILQNVGVGEGSRSSLW